MHGVQPLKEDKYLYNNALILAKQFLEDGTVENSYLNYKEGQELGMLNIINEEELSPEELMDMWYKENKRYNFQEPESQDNSLYCYNFTQMVWKDSQKFGIGFYCLTEEMNKKTDNSKRDKEEEEEKEEEENKKVKTKKFCYVALYFPAGNKQGEYKKNVLKKIQKPTTNGGNSDNVNKAKQNKKLESQIKEKTNFSKESEVTSRNKKKEKEEKEGTKDGVTINFDPKTKVYENH